MAITTLPAVRIGTAVSLGEGAAVAVTAVTEIDVEATGPGEVAGPGIAVRVRVTNRGAVPIDLGGFSVTASYGEGRPASPSGLEQSAELVGLLDAGAARAGSYVFLVPRSAAGGVRVQVTSSRSPVVATYRR